MSKLAQTRDLLLSGFSQYKSFWLRLFSLFVLFLMNINCRASERKLANTDTLFVNDIICLNDSINFEVCGDEARPNPILQLIKNKRKKNKKVFAAILAFPFPFGIVALHRIYLGTSPYVPVAYIASLGGVFGILPFIDFCVLVLDKDIDRYIENPKVFMWVNE